jgi:hypothetical protein
LVVEAVVLDDLPVTEEAATTTDTERLLTDLGPEVLEHIWVVLKENNARPVPQDPSRQHITRQNLASCA